MLKVWVLSAMLLFGTTTKHDYHTSITEIHFNKDTKSLELSIRLFTDDLEQVLTAQNKGVKIKIEDNSKAVDALIEKYIMKNLAIVSPQKEVKLARFYGKEQESDGTWVYFEIENCGNIKNYTFYNALMQETFEDQTNIVNIFYPSQKKTMVFNHKTLVQNWPF